MTPHVDRKVTANYPSGHFGSVRETLNLDHDDDHKTDVFLNVPELWYL